MLLTDPPDPNHIDDIVKILTLFGGLGTFIWTVYTWRQKSLQELNAARSDAESAKTTRRIEATKPFLDRQLELYTQITRTMATIASSEDPIQIRLAITAFWQLYYGELALVENPEVEAAMVAIGKILTTSPEVKHYIEEREKIQNLSLVLVEACRKSLDSSWGIHAWTTPDLAARDEAPSSL